jgi:hypothetical protein
MNSPNESHELAHLVQGCQGESTSGTPLKYSEESPQSGEIPYIAIDPRSGLPDRRDDRPTRWFLGDANKEFSGDQGEYDAVMSWENPIAYELGELPRFIHG